MVTPQAFDHAKCIGRPFEQLCELLVVEPETSTPRRLCTSLVCCGISLISSAG